MLASLATNRVEKLHSTVQLHREWHVAEIIGNGYQCAYYRLIVKNACISDPYQVSFIIIQCNIPPLKCETCRIFLLNRP